MNQKQLNHQSRYLVILSGAILERLIEERARQVAVDGTSNDITPEDVRKAVETVMEQDLHDLPNLIREAIQEHWDGITEAA